MSGVAYHWYAGDGWHELERLQDPNRVGSHQLVVVTVAVSQARVFFFHNRRVETAGEIRSTSFQLRRYAEGT